MRIAVVAPTRGLIFTECQVALEENLAEFDYKIFRSFLLPIPDSHNFLTQKALREDPDYILFIEEDIVMPDNSLIRMVNTKADIVCVDYGVAGYSCITEDKNTKEKLWCGLGCTLVRSTVFDKLEMPYFKSDKQLLLNNYPIEEWVKSPPNNYGGQDIYFFIQARKAGYKITKIEDEARHLELRSLGRKGVNNGIHYIKDREKISKHQLLPL